MRDIPDESVGSLLSTALRRGHRRIDCRAAAGRHPRRGYRNAVAAVALSAAGGRRTAAGGVLRSFGRGYGAGGPTGCSARCRPAWGNWSARSSGACRRTPFGATRRPSALVRRGAEWTVTAGGADIAARAVILAVPSPVAARLLAALDDRAAALCAGVPYVSTVSVALALSTGGSRASARGQRLRRRAAVTNGLRITACTWVSSKWSGRAPADHVLLRVFVGGAHDPGAIDLGDDRLVDMAWREAGGVLGISSAPELARVYRWRHAGAQHNVGQQARMRRTRRASGHAPRCIRGRQRFPIDRHPRLHRRRPRRRRRCRPIRVPVASGFSRKNHSALSSRPWTPSFGFSRKNHRLRRRGRRPSFRLQPEIRSASAGRSFGFIRSLGS